MKPILRRGQHYSLLLLNYTTTNAKTRPEQEEGQIDPTGFSSETRTTLRSAGSYSFNL